MTRMTRCAETTLFWSEAPAFDPAETGPALAAMLARLGLDGAQVEHVGESSTLIAAPGVQVLVALAAPSAGPEAPEGQSHAMTVLVTPRRDGSERRGIGNEAICRAATRQLVSRLTPEQVIAGASQTRRPAGAARSGADRRVAAPAC